MLTLLSAVIAVAASASVRSAAPRVAAPRVPVAVAPVAAPAFLAPSLTGASAAPAPLTAALEAPLAAGAAAPGSRALPLGFVAGAVVGDPAMRNGQMIQVMYEPGIVLTDEYNMVDIAGGIHPRFMTGATLEKTVRDVIAPWNDRAIVAEFAGRALRHPGVVGVKVSPAVAEVHAIVSDPAKVEALGLDRWRGLTRDLDSPYAYGERDYGVFAARVTFASPEDAARAEAELARTSAYRVENRRGQLEFRDQFETVAAALRRWADLGVVSRIETARSLIWRLSLQDLGYLPEVETPSSPPDAEPVRAESPRAPVPSKALIASVGVVSAALGASAYFVYPYAPFIVATTYLAGVVGLGSWVYETSDRFWSWSIVTGIGLVLGLGATALAAVAWQGAPLKEFIPAGLALFGLFAGAAASAKGRSADR